MIPRSLLKTCEIYSEWQAEVTIDFLDQIIKSPEMIAESAKLPNQKVRKIRGDKKNILKKALRYEAEEIIKKSKSKTEKDFYTAVEEMPDYKLRNLRKKMIEKVLGEL